MIRTVSLLLLFVCVSPVWAQSDQTELQLTLPPQVYAVAGLPTSIYFDNVVLTQSPQDYRFEVTCDVGSTEDRRWTVTPTNQDAGDHPLQVSVYTADDKLVESKSSVLGVTADRAHPTEPPMQLLIIGDSLTHATQYPNEIARLLTPNHPWKMLGTHLTTSAKPGVAHEGFGGWTWSSFTSKYEPNPDGSVQKRSSPFVFLNDDSEPELDVDRYFAEDGHDQLPTHVVIMLGINDCFHAPSDNDAAIDATIDRMFSHADRLLAAIQSAAPKADVGLCLTTPPNARQEAFQANYQDRYTRWGWKRIQHRLVQRQMQYVAAKSDSKIHIVPTQLNLDPVDGYPHNNGVHPNSTGYKQIGAAIHAWLCQQLERATWAYSADPLRPFWTGDSVEQEPVLFLQDADSDLARGSLLFPIQEIVSVQSSSGDITYENETDYRFTPGSREITIPAGSRIVTTSPAELRRPAKSQRFQLTHRDGNGEIMFGAKLEYHQLQTNVTYKTATKNWDLAMPTFDAGALPTTIKKLRDGDELSVVLLGDSISTGCNSSGWGHGAPYQPPYQDLLVDHLQAHYDTKVNLTNLSVGGQSTPWGITMIDQVVSHHPDLVILAFGMNDSAGRSATEFRQNTEAMIQKTRDAFPNSEFILIATMLGNRDWTRLNHDVFPEYRDQLAQLCEPGIALADMTSVWSEFMKRKKDSDLTGNGVNHPNDFGHRVYAQVLSTLLVE
ncbi:GDSL-like Lipase/Acylhydrolase [Rubripirellula lacrimiformis]|uniref:GDSL-like Lipase/Acylhydrolase n=1 Tax=Rubripirellula lacrimiformis TaxID=1930273 RepID=A0A517NEU8_9BACT|nr:SGNH/GDSL hydrolase family protein [Rubripirellula lacrimiformis]QDT05655.1 GDSL-like Lipase/Acylhydrolase [Rubripirellula lacrimiformis]